MGELDDYSAVVDGYSRRRRRRAATAHSAAVAVAPASAADGHRPLQIGGESSRARIEVCLLKVKSEK